jgi:hypothetical protein
VIAVQLLVLLAERLHRTERLHIEVHLINLSRTHSSSCSLTPTCIHEASRRELNRTLDFISCRRKCLLSLDMTVTSLP